MGMDVQMALGQNLMFIPLHNNIIPIYRLARVWMYRWLYDRI